MNPQNGTGRPSRVSEDARLTLLMDALREPVLRRVIQALGLGEGSRGLDVGCGPGLPTRLLADAVGPAGHVTGLDIRCDMVAQATQCAEPQGWSGRVSFRHGDVHDLPFGDNEFDWAWSSDCVGYASMDPLPPLREMARVIQPGGTLAVAAWSSQQLLPGFPQLEAHLNATAVGIAPFTSGQRPERHFLRGLGWMEEVGLSEVRARSFVHGVQAPLEPDERDALAALLDMRWGGAQSAVAPEDWDLFMLLCDPNSPQCILDAPDYHGFFTYTLFCGSVPS